MFVAYINIITMKRRDFLKNAGRVASSAAILGSSSVVLNAAETEPEKFPVHEIVEDELNANLDKPLTAIVIGAGARGSIYTQYASLYPNSLKVVGVSDINEFRRNRMADQFHVPAENRMGDWSEVFKRPKFADLVFITTPDALCSLHEGSRNGVSCFIGKTGSSDRKTLLGYFTPGSKV